MTPFATAWTADIAGGKAQVLVFLWTEETGEIVAHHITVAAGDQLKFSAHWEAADWAKAADYLHALRTDEVAGGVRARALVEHAFTTILESEKGEP